MNRHDVRYVFEHRVLPQGFFEEKSRFVGFILSDKHILFRIIDDFFQKEKIDNPYEDDNFKIVASRITEDVTMLNFIFPEPEEEPLCYSSYLFFDKEFEKLSYFCIEKGNPESVNYPFVCSWTSDGSHLNHGNCTFEEHNDLLRCVELHMKRYYGSSDSKN